MAQHEECCVFHGNKHRSEFQFILNFLRKNCLMVKIDFKRAAQLVCCCKLDHDSEQASQNLMSVKGTLAEDQSSDDEVEKTSDKDLLKKQDGAFQSVLKLNMIPDKVQEILEKWIKRNPDAESHVHYGNSRISALMILCLKGKYRPLLKTMVECGPREYVLIVPIPRKLVKPFFELDMAKEREEFGFAVDVLDSPLTGLIINETFLKVTCDEQHIKAVRILLVNKAKELVTKEKEEKESAKRKRKCCYSTTDEAESDSGSSDTDSSNSSCEYENDVAARFIKPSKKDLEEEEESVSSDVDSDMENDVDSDQMSSDVKSVLKNKNKRMRMA